MSCSILKKFVLLGVLLAAVVLVGAADTGAANAGAAKVFPKFSSQGFKGEAVSDALFADATLTMLNIWATWCPPCVSEMPDLGRLGRSMPKGSQLAGIILDAGEPDAMSDADGILTKAQADFLQILPSEEMRPVLEEIDAIPTTLFVDSQGRIVGKPLVGSRSEEAYRAEIEKLLESLR
jgi:thiol-disulfide isomerase/thioredoxin